MFEINKELVLSTRHISLRSSQKLEKIAPDWSLCDCFPFGWRILISEETIEEIILQCPTMRKVVYLAKELGCKWLVLDQDGPVVESLDKFDW